jgi:hypothetical protein
MSRRFQFSLGRLLAAMAPLAVAALFLRYTLDEPLAAPATVSVMAISLAWAAAILFRNLAIAWIGPFVIVIAITIFILLIKLIW